ncbi:hypothetical protein K439DRAFT_1619369 [Ramaria rubella]|nr:hypothetical protein K439DRAFT_1619369 [Ramaria rubella]
MSSEVRWSVHGEEHEGKDDGVAFLAFLTKPELDELKVMVHLDYIYQWLLKRDSLQLMGGVDKQAAEGMNIRGDSSICIVRTPKFRKYIPHPSLCDATLPTVCSSLPCAIYTPREASSAAGLTTAVVKDGET